MYFDSIQCYASYCVTMNRGVFLGKMCSDRRKNHVYGQKIPEGPSSARFGLRTAAKCGELKHCANWAGSRTDNKDEVVKGKFSNLNFLPSTRKTTEYSFTFFLKFLTSFLSNLIVLLHNQAKFLKKLFFKSDGGHAISWQERHRLPKSTMRFPIKKKWHSPPPPCRVVLELPSPSPRVCTDRRAGVHSHHSANFLDR